MPSLIIILRVSTAGAHVAGQGRADYIVFGISKDQTAAHSISVFVVLGIGYLIGRGNSEMPSRT